MFSNYTWQSKIRSRCFTFLYLKWLKIYKQSKLKDWKISTLYWVKIDKNSKFQVSWLLVLPPSLLFGEPSQAVTLASRAELSTNEKRAYTSFSYKRVILALLFFPWLNFSPFFRGDHLNFMYYLLFYLVEVYPCWNIGCPCLNLRRFLNAEFGNFSYW